MTWELYVNPGSPGSKPDRENHSVNFRLPHITKKSKKQNENTTMH